MYHFCDICCIKFGPSAIQGNFWTADANRLANGVSESLDGKSVAGAHEKYKRWPLLRTNPLPAPFPPTMNLTPTDDPMSIFVGGKLKPGRYKVQNLASQTYLEVLEPSKELCCRPASVLSPEDALVIPEHTPNRRTRSTFLMLRGSQWDFQPSGSGYKIKKVRTNSDIHSTELLMTNPFERSGAVRSTEEGQRSTVTRWEGSHSSGSAA